MDCPIIIDPNLTKLDKLVLQSLEADINDFQSHTTTTGNLNGQRLINDNGTTRQWRRDEATLAALNALNNPKGPDFEPTVFNGTDLDRIQLPQLLDRCVLQPFIRLARSIVRVETDVVMITHLALIFATSIPSALFLMFWHFSWIHGILHFVMQFSYMGSYTLMMHQHIHQRGILSRKYLWLDVLFPYITDPLMGHTWNSYFYHHVKHHHLEGNGPDDLSTTIRYQRDNIFHLLHYIGRFFFFIWVDLPIYFFRKGKTSLALKAAFWEAGCYISFYLLYRFNPKATFCIFLLPHLTLRLGLMVGNWGQHAFVDNEDPDSDYRMSVTLIDVASNRHCFNDGYHTSHHLNPLRHWREHPAAFMKAKDVYSSQNALVFHNIDYIMITVRLMMHDYDTLARCMVPIGPKQISLSLDERATLLRRHTRQFTEEEIRAKYKTE